MLFNKFQKVPSIYLLMPLGFIQWGKQLPPKKYVNVLPFTVYIHVEEVLSGEGALWRKKSAMIPHDLCAESRQHNGPR